MCDRSTSAPQGPLILKPLGLGAEASGNLGCRKDLLPSDPATKLEQSVHETVGGLANGCMRVGMIASTRMVTITVVASFERLRSSLAEATIRADWANPSSLGDRRTGTDFGSDESGHRFLCGMTRERPRPAQFGDVTQF